MCCTCATANSAQPAIESAISRLQVAHATTEPRRPTQYRLLISVRQASSFAEHSFLRIAVPLLHLYLNDLTQLKKFHAHFNWESAQVTAYVYLVSVIIISLCIRTKPLFYCLLFSFTIPPSSPCASELMISLDLGLEQADKHVICSERKRREKPDDSDVVYMIG